MCLACEMENEFWLAYREYEAEQDRKAAGETAAQAKPALKPVTAPQFVCEEPPSE